MNTLSIDDQDYLREQLIKDEYITNNFKLTDEDIQNFDLYKLDQLKYFQFRKAEYFNFNIVEDNIYPELIEYVDEVLFNKFEQDLFMGQLINSNKRKKLMYKKLLYIVIANLYNANYNNLFLMTSRDRKYYNSKNKSKMIITQNLKLFSYTFITNIFDWLEKNELVDTKYGYVNYTTKQGRRTRYLPKNELLFKIQEINEKYNQEIFLNYDQTIEFSDRYLIVKEKKINGNKGKIIPDLIKGANFPKSINTIYKKKIYLKKLKYNVYMINEYLNKTRIIIQNPITKYDRTYINLYLVNHRMAYKLDKNTFLLNNKGKNYIRVFNDECFDKGGRLYAPFQQLSSNTRLNSLLNDETVAGVDIKNSHIRMLYHYENIEYNEDAYEIGYDSSTNFEKRKILRKINKKLLQILINSKSEDSAIRSAHKAIISEFKSNNKKFMLEKFNSFKPVKTWLNEIKEKHYKIKKYFYGEVGIYLQYIESELLIKTIIELVRSNVPSLCVHDELIVPKNKVVLTKLILEDIYTKNIILGKNLLLEIKEST
jgi:hypothetical protein